MKCSWLFKPGLILLKSSVQTCVFIPTLFSSITTESWRVRNQRWNDSKAVLTLIRFSLSYCEDRKWRRDEVEGMEQKRERVAVKSSDRAMTVTQASDLLNQRVHYCVTVLQKKRKGTKKKKRERNRGHRRVGMRRGMKLVCEWRVCCVAVESWKAVAAGGRQLCVLM